MNFQILVVHTHRVSWVGVAVVSESSGLLLLRSVVSVVAVLRLRDKRVPDRTNLFVELGVGRCGEML